MPLLVSDAAADPHRAFPFSCSKLDRHSTRGNKQKRKTESEREEDDRQSEEEASVSRDERDRDSN